MGFTFDSLRAAQPAAPHKFQSSVHDSAQFRNKRSAAMTCAVCGYGRTARIANHVTERTPAQ